GENFIPLWWKKRPKTTFIFFTPYPCPGLFLFFLMMCAPRAGGHTLHNLSRWQYKTKPGRCI
ncbi:MAG: hypothetical protein AAGD25_21350, partial [Cyanobacteria bacterium P01_F01_bin.150]